MLPVRDPKGLTFQFVLCNWVRLCRQQKVWVV